MTQHIHDPVVAELKLDGVLRDDDHDMLRFYIDGRERITMANTPENRDLLIALGEQLATLGGTFTCSC